MVLARPFPQVYPQVLWNANSTCLNTLQPEFRFAVLGESPFLGLELRSVNHQAGILYARLMFHVKHFMKQHVFGDTKRNVRGIKQTAEKDRVVGHVESAEHITRFLRRP